MVKLKYYSLAEAHQSKGVTVVIDVLRAFTTAAFAFERGVEKIIPVSSVAEAVALKKTVPNSLIMGEVNGYKPERFDFSNSPNLIARADINGKTLIQRTSAGTQGLVKAEYATHLAAASFVVANATAKWLQLMEPEQISFIITGDSLGRDGDEDRACAEYIAALVQGRAPDPADYTRRIMTSSVGESFLSGKTNYLLKDDLLMSAQTDIFDFALSVSREEGHLVMRKFVDFNVPHE